MRGVWVALGLILVGTGFVGIVVPGLPSTIFLILAVACFKKGSPKLEAWLLNHPWFGPSLRDWEANGWISKRVKWISVSCIVLFGVGACFSLKVTPFGISSWWFRSAFLAFCAYGVWFILSRPTKPNLRLVESGPKESAKPVEPELTHTK